MKLKPSIARRIHQRVAIVGQGRLDVAVLETRFALPEPLVREGVNLFVIHARDERGKQNQADHKNETTEQDRFPGINSRTFILHRARIGRCTHAQFRHKKNTLSGHISTREA